MHPEQLDMIFNQWIGSRKVQQVPMMTFGAQHPVITKPSDKEGQAQQLGSWKKHQPVAHPQFALGLSKKLNLKRMASSM